MEICREGEGSDWTERWERNYMELSLEKWLNDGRDTIADKTEVRQRFYRHEIQVVGTRNQRKYRPCLE